MAAIFRTDRNRCCNTQYFVIGSKRRKRIAETIEHSQHCGECGSNTSKEMLSIAYLDTL